MHEAQKPKIDYPCPWRYRVIGEDRARLQAAIASVLLERAHTLSEGNTSAKGRYVSLGLEVIVTDEDDRLRISEQLGHHPDVRMVL